MKKSTSTHTTLVSAGRLTIILSVIMLIIVLATVAAVRISIKSLQNYATTVSHKKIDAQASNNNIMAYQRLQDDLVKTKDARDKYDSLRSKSEFPEFAIVNIVKKIALKNHIGIQSFSYGGSASEAAGSTAPAATSSSGTAATTPPAAAGSSGGASSDKFSLTVNFSEKVNYQDYLQFLYDTEQTLPKLQVEGVGISSGDSRSTVKADPLTIQMYVSGGGK